MSKTKHYNWQDDWYIMAGTADMCSYSGGVGYIPVSE